MADEEALIVWDAERGMQHFVRRAAFHTEADDFGFLVPTPARPELAEADDDVFARLAEVIQPAVVHTSSPVFHTCCTAACGALLLSAGREVETAGVPDVIVHVETRVAGMDAAVLEARDAEALAVWLTEHGYAMRPALQRWVTPYVEAGWFISAFKIAGDGGGPSIGTRALRMSFATDRPFYPYREPDDVDEQARALRVFLVAGERMSGSLAGQNEWSGEVRLARSMSGLEALLAGTMPEGRAPRAGWLTVFNDVHTERPDADLFFTAAGVADEVVPPPIVVADEYMVPIPLEPVLIGGFVFYFWWRRRGRTEAR